MPKQKTSAQILVADGAGGMRSVDDLRFDDAAWPIAFVVPGRDAEAWVQHLHAELLEREWSWSGQSELDAAENSGTLQVRTASGSSSPSLDVVWERPRGKNLKVRARGSGTPPLPVDEVRKFLESVNARQRAGKTIRRHRRCFLMYEGLPWRGELWLDPSLRLGPPSKFPEGLLGPQALVVDALMEGIGEQGVNAQFGRVVEELRIFLNAALGLNVACARSPLGWATEFAQDGRVECRLLNIGYSEPNRVSEMPSAGGVPPITRRSVTRPGLGPFGIWPDMHEAWVPDDIEGLWAMFQKLPRARREQFMKAGNAYSIALQMWPAQRTAYAAFLVVACEALKPVGRRHDRMNIYDVVASLVGVSEAAALRGLSVSPQKVRSQHLHRGELLGDEFGTMMMVDYFADPSFGRMLFSLSQISRVCLIEWLRRRGTYTVVRLPRSR